MGLGESETLAIAKRISYIADHHSAQNDHIVCGGHIPGLAGIHKTLIPEPPPYDHPYFPRCGHTVQKIKKMIL